MVEVGPLSYKGFWKEFVHLCPTGWLAGGGVGVGATKRAIWRTVLEYLVSRTNLECYFTAVMCLLRTAFEICPSFVKYGWIQNGFLPADQLQVPAQGLSSWNENRERIGFIKHGNWILYTYLHFTAVSIIDLSLIAMDSDWMLSGVSFRFASNIRASINKKYPHCKMTG